MRSFLFNDNSALLREADAVIDQVFLSNKPRKRARPQTSKQSWQEVFDSAMERYS